MIYTTDQWLRSFSYDAATGIFTRTATPYQRTDRVGKVAGGIGKNGYVYVSLGTKRYLAHRLAWLFVTGAWPTKNIDHINGDPSDNRFCNLREADQSQNLGNKRVQRNSSTGIKGVHWVKARQKYEARIAKNGKSRVVGQFKNIEDAAAAYAKAAREVFGEFARC